MKNIQPKPSCAIIFDFGGVLMDWNPRYLYSKLFKNDIAAMERFLQEIEFDAWNQEQDRGRSFGDAVSLLSKRFPHYQELIQAYDTRWEESLSGEIPETVEILRKLKQANYPLYGLSNWSAEKFPLVQNTYHFFDWFDLIVLSGEVKIAKPDPEIFDVLLERIHRKAKECLFIDDSMQNISTAEKLGLQTIHFQSPDQLHKALVAKGIL
jgi:2-haloacid dehalogenase